METTSTSLKICAGYEPIAGYKLEQLIGRGGFGEVWHSEAPGGLHKAVKFVYGSTDQHRAQRELRSLERIKGVHHPFLLTLERFGVVDDRLVIVTELADGSLEDVYNRHRERGSCGIPRASLLSYLHDAGDALDYLHTNFQLQHLDVKPGNLLMVGGHVKVGDFGLLKDLRDVECSVVGGLTPVYAPPELFDGRPSMHSDQYSLAVMYQELLTGTRPFSGRTIAHLATQHVHSAPNLNPLPASDRPVIAKALEKDPQRRFASCCEFIDALRASTTRSSRSMMSDSSLEQGDTLTGEFRGDNGVPMPTVKDLPQLKISIAQGGVRITGHSLVVAIGGAGAEVLASLRDRVASQRAACPVDLHSILIDTDSATIQAARLAEVSDRVPVCQSLYTPLKSPQEYRNYQGIKYKSLSRRWLYNVPRSGATEGMRPLGRLALVDHAEEVLRQLRESIGHLGAVAGSSSPNVFVVSSIDGGTGSGMVLDIMHLIRHVLDEFSMAQVRVVPMLVAGPLQRSSSRPLAVSDAAATMNEIQYFLSPGNGYPGDAATNWPSVPAARTPLSDAYLVTAGLAGESIPDPIETVVEYIWLESTGAAEFFAAARANSGEEPVPGQIATPCIRSVGIVRLRTPKMLEENLLAPSVVRKLLFRWLGSPAEAKELAPELAARMIRRSGVSAETFLKHCGGRWSIDPVVRRGQLAAAIKALAESIRSDRQQFEGALMALAQETLPAESNDLVEQVMLSLKREISIRLCDGRCDLALAFEAMQRIEQAVNESVDACRTEPLENESSAAGAATISLETVADRWLWRIVRANAAEMLANLSAQLRVLRERMSDHAATLAQCVGEVSARITGNDDDLWRFVDEGVCGRVESVIEGLHKQVSSSVLGSAVMQEGEAVASHTLLQSLLDRALPLIEAAVTWATEVAITAPASAGAASSPAALKQRFGASPMAVTQTYLSPEQTTTMSLDIENETTPSDAYLASRPWDDPELIAAAIRAVKPSLLTCGGCQRMLLIAGSEQERERIEPKIRAVHNGPLTTAVINGAAAMLVCEAQQIKVADVCSRIVTVAGDQQDILGRLVARSDIDWKSTMTTGSN